MLFFIIFSTMYIISQSTLQKNVFMEKLWKKFTGCRKKKFEDDSLVIKIFRQVIVRKKLESLLIIFNVKPIFVQHSAVDRVFSRMWKAFGKMKNRVERIFFVFVIASIVPRYRANLKNETLFPSELQIVLSILY